MFISKIRKIVKVLLSGPFWRGLFSDKDIETMEMSRVTGSKLSAAFLSRLSPRRLGYFRFERDLGEI